MEWLRNLIWVLTASGCTLYLGQTWLKAASAERQSVLFCALLALLLITGLASLVLLESSFGWNLSQARQWLDQAARLLGLPLLTLGIYSLSQGGVWAKATWGRWVLGLCLAFELARILNASLGYAQLLAVASAALLLVAAWPWRIGPKLWISLGGAGLVLALPWLNPNAQLWAWLLIGPLAVWLIRHQS